MKKQRSNFLVNSVFIGIIFILLIFLKRMDYRVSELEKRDTVIEKVEIKEDLKPDRISSIPVVQKKPNFKGIIGIIIDDFGYRNDEVSDGFLKLNANLTYAVIPGHKYSTQFGERAVKNGYEVIVHMPMENLSNKGGEEKFVLSTFMDKNVIQDRVKTALNQIPSAIGMNNHQGSKASADQYVMSNVARVLKEKNLFFIDSRTTAETVAESTMEVFGVPTTRRNVFLDNDDNEEKILKQLKELTEKSEEWRRAVGIGHVKLKTLKILQKKIPELQRKGFKFEFVSKMLH